MPSKDLITLIERQDTFSDGVSAIGFTRRWGQLSRDEQTYTSALDAWRDFDMNEDVATKRLWSHLLVRFMPSNGIDEARVALTQIFDYYSTRAALLGHGEHGNEEESTTPGEWVSGPELSYLKASAEDVRLTQEEIDERLNFYERLFRMSSDEFYKERPSDVLRTIHGSEWYALLDHLEVLESK